MEKTRTYKTAVYMRLSRDDGDDKESQSISNQRKSIYEFIEKANANTNQDNFFIIGDYIDDGYTGSNYNRPDFQKLLGDIEQEKVDCIITKDLSRLGRDHIKTGEYIEDYFRERDIRYIAINDNIDSKEEETFDMVEFRLAFNSFYPKDTSKKVRKIKKLKAEKGEYQRLAPTISAIKRVKRRKINW